ncbi:unnamed protein product [Clonostachys rosea]|uniref:BTB domain-containing protein n=1 Tax=Bionectria ochroleuca TaxID=29856 RepID=A0ABY6V0Z4_BIOOC|nr:unnamed protein product [Clonostachys rosea]
MIDDERSFLVDARERELSKPLQSPYSSKSCAIFFEDEGPIYVHKKLLDASPKLVPKNGRLDFDDISIDVGHILVHFLFTEKYQYLGLRRQTKDEVLDEFSTALLACSAAKTLELPGLFRLAKEQLEIVGNQLKLTSIVRAIEALRPSPINILEVAAYLSSRVERLVKSSSSDTSRIMSDELAEPTTASEVLLRCILQLQVAPSTVKDESTQAEDVVISDISNTEVGGSEEPPAQESLTMETHNLATVGIEKAVAEESRAEEAFVKEASPIKAATPNEEPVPIEEPVPVDELVPIEELVPTEEPIRSQIFNADSWILPPTSKKSKKKAKKQRAPEEDVPTENWN